MGEILYLGVRNQSYCEGPDIVNITSPEFMFMDLLAYSICSW